MRAIVQNIDKTDAYSLSLKREDLLFPEISGNKYRKLKYQLSEINKRTTTTILTFGGAFSNHISAVAAVGKKYGLHTIGIIRGDELKSSFSKNPTLAFAKGQGMQLEFISRESYRQKESPTFIESLRKMYGDFYLLPEGGTNALAVKGCAEILNNEDAAYDYICVPVGTGGTLAGIVSSLLPHQYALGFSVLKGTFQKEIVTKHTSNENYEILDSYNFGGYAKIDTHLVRFINTFNAAHNIRLDPVYTGKMMYGIQDLIQKHYFKENSRILAIHTGGLQGIEGMNLTLKKKKLPLIL